LVSWKLDGDARFRRYAFSAVLGWSAFIPSIPFYLAQRKLSTQYNWIEVPPVSDLMARFDGNIERFFAPIATLLLLSWLVAECIDDSRVCERVARRPGLDARHVGIFLAVTIAFLPAVWLESRWGARIFHPRYLFLTSVAWVVAIGLLFDCIFERLWGLRANPVRRPVSDTVILYRERWIRVAGRSLVCFNAVFLVIVVVALLARGRSSSMKISAKLEHDLAATREYPDYPVITTDDFDFTCLAYYLRPSNRVFLLTDEWYSGSISGSRIGAAMERHYFPNTMRKMPEFLGGHDRFLIVGATVTSVVSKLMSKAPEWEGREITDRVWLLHRRQ
jgi:hypothetical protein